MGRERTGDGAPKKSSLKLHNTSSKEGVSSSAITPLSQEQRKIYPHVIYEIDSNSPLDVALTIASKAAMASANFPVVVDIDEGGIGLKAVVRTSTSEQRDRTVESALFLGLTEATRRQVNQTVDSDNTQQSETPSVSGFAHVEATANHVLQDLLSKPELYKAFQKYYGGLRWHTDQEPFVRQLFISGANFDQEFLDKNLTGGWLSNFVYRLDVDIPYEARRNWSETQTTEIFESFPELDYRRLQDDEFRSSAQGQTLLREYTMLIGDISSDLAKNSFRWQISEAGEILSKPLIPLSKHPLIEALVVDELSVDRPKPKYNFGPADLTDFVLNSDSIPAHQSLVTAICTRLPEGSRRVFDGPNEFEHKHRNIASILHTYQEPNSDSQRRDLLKADLVTVIDAFTGDGEITRSVREEGAKEMARSIKLGYKPYSREVGQLREITTDLIRVGIVAPDPEISLRTKDLITGFISNKNTIAKPDILALDRTDLMLALLDSLKEVSTGTQASLLEECATLIFGDETIGAKFGEMVNISIKATEIRNSREALLASRHMSKFGLSFGKEPELEELEARSQLDELLKPADKLDEEKAQVKNQLILNLLTQLADSGVAIQSDQGSKLFKELVRRVEFKHYKINELPNEYHELLELAHNPKLSVNQRNDILWHFQNQFEYVDAKTAKLLIPVILDMYEVALGPVDAIRLPEDETDFGLAAISAIIHRTGHQIFKSASREQLETLARYETEIRLQAERIAAGALLDDGQTNSSIGNLTDWQRETIENIGKSIRELDAISDQYGKYLRIESVKVFPHVYYPWVLEQFASFWQKMQWEVGPGNRPSREMSELYQVLGNQLKNKIKILNPEEYTEDFDAIDEGHIDTFLKECYERMVVRSDLQYNSTVWQEGLPFVHAAVSYMPSSLIDRIKAKYPNSGFAEYVETEHERWNKESE